MKSVSDVKLNYTIQKAINLIKNAFDAKAYTDTKSCQFSSCSSYK